MTTDLIMVRIAVIGAGAAGLCAARHIAHHDGMSCVVYEQTDAVGGTWCYTDNVGTNKYGLPVHTSMYKNLRTNLPKEVMGFPDFPIPEQDKSYIPAEDVLRFLNAYADHFGIRKYIKFNHNVKRVHPKRKRWEVTAVHLPTKQEFTEQFDAVMVCNGHYHTPLNPQIPGIDTFKGDQVHSHDYRKPDPFKGKSVVVIGAGPSGMDLTLEISSVAKQVSMSHHLAEEINTCFPPNVRQKPDVKHVEGNTVVFEDGSRQETDILFYCTGYLYSFPFLSEECRVTVEDNCVQPLYKHLIHMDHTTLCLVGLPYYVCAFTMFDLQVRFFLKTLSGEVSLPSKEEMIQDSEKETAKRREKGLKKKQFHMMGPMQDEYYDSLSEAARLPRIPPVMTKLHNESSQRFLDDLVNYRNDVYRIIDDSTYVKVN